MRLVRGCLTCGGSEHPARTYTALYRDGEGGLQFSWLCRECVTALGAEHIRDLSEDDILCRNKDMRLAYDRGLTAWTGDYPPGLILDPKRNGPGATRTGGCS